MRTKALFLMFLALPVFLGAEPQSDFWKFLKSEDYTNAFEALQAWEKQEPNSPEVVVGYIDYHFFKSRTYGYSIDDFVKTGKGQEDSKLTFHDPKSGKDYYFNNKVFYDAAEINESMKYFDIGISKFPDRLDIRYGKIHVLNEVEEYARAGVEVAKTIERSVKNKNVWLWADNKPYGKNTNNFLRDLQDYYNIWFKSQDASALPAIKVAAEAQIRFYPNHSWAYDNLAEYYRLVHDDANWIRFLLDSLRVDPTDLVTINNIANYYRLHNDKQKALQYYNIMLKSDDANAKMKAKQMIDSLNNAQ